MRASVAADMVRIVLNLSSPEPYREVCTPPLDRFYICDLIPSTLNVANIALTANTQAASLQRGGYIFAR